MRSYKLRAEGLNDLWELFKIITINKYTIEGNNTAPDVTFVFKTRESKDEMVEKINNCITDGHVMAETLEFEENYTGHRK